MPRGLVNGDAGAIDRFDREVLDRLLVSDVRRIKIWRADGTIVYSDETQLIGKRFNLDDEQLSVLHSGDTEGGVSDLRRRENRFESEEGGLLEVYTRIESPEGQPLLFEAYYSVETVKQRSVEVLHAVPADHARCAGRAAAARRTAARRSDPPAHPRGAGARATDAARDRVVGGGAPADRPRPARRRRPGAGRYGVRALGHRARAFVVAGAPGRARRAPARRCARSLRQLRSLLVEIHPPGLERCRAGRGAGGPDRARGFVRDRRRRCRSRAWRMHPTMSSRWCGGSRRRRSGTPSDTRRPRT